MMMKHHNQQQQQPMNGGSGMHGGGSPTETKWWYKGPDGETYGPYKAREMHTWGSTGYFNESLPVKTENDDCFHPIGEWMGLMGGANPFAAPSVPAFNVLMHGAQAQQFLLYPPGLPTPAPFAAAGGPPPQQQQQQSNGGAQQQQQRSYGGPAYMPTNGGGGPPSAAAAAMANLHLGGGAHMGMHPMHHGGPLSQPLSEGPGDGANSSNSHTPDSAEPDFRTLHQMGGMPPSMQQQHAGRMQFGYGMPPMQQHPHQQQHAQQQQLQHPMGGGATHAANGQLQFTRVTSTHDAPWNSRREVAIDASQRPVQGKTISTQTLPVIIGSKDASRILSDLTGCAIVIT
ncbi:sao-1 [Pristionchus pacificus]|nr:sao-1 [Pristionchus pacificus]